MQALVQSHIGDLEEMSSQRGDSMQHVDSLFAKLNKFNEESQVRMTCMSKKKFQITAIFLQELVNFLSNLLNMQQVGLVYI